MPSPKKTGLMTQEYKILHQVAKTLHASDDAKHMLKNVLKVITQFHDLRVESKAGIFLADEEKRTLRLFTTIGNFSKEFLYKEKEVPFGECLCGRAAESGEMLMSNSCFTDSRHERTFSDMTAHGHYIVPLKSGKKLVGIMFLYTNTNPTWYEHSQEVLLSIGGLIADAIEQKRNEEALKKANDDLEREISLRKKVEEELVEYRDHLEDLVATRTRDLTHTNELLQEEINERKNVENKLRSIKDKLRNLNNRLVVVREEEKTRIAREVHDELGQSLTGLKMDLSYLEKKLPREQGDLHKKAESMKNLIDSTISSVQRISMELRPPILDAFGICEAIAWQASEFQSRTGIEFDLNCLDQNVKLDRDRSTALFRIFQETLTNIFRHAEASKVQVSLSLVKNQLILVINDNGKGIKDSEIENPMSLGLLGIRERVLAFNGEFEIHGSPGKGTAVTVTLPYK